MSDPTVVVVTTPETPPEPIPEPVVIQEPDPQNTSALMELTTRIEQLRAELQEYQTEHAGLHQSLREELLAQTVAIAEVEEAVAEEEMAETDEPTVIEVPPESPPEERQSRSWIGELFWPKR